MATTPSPDDRREAPGQAPPDCQAPTAKASRHSAATGRQEGRRPRARNAGGAKAAHGRTPRRRERRAPGRPPSVASTAACRGRRRSEVRRARRADPVGAVLTAVDAVVVDRDGDRVVAAAQHAEEGRARAPEARAPRPPRRNRLEREVKKTRTRVERELRQRRNRVEREVKRATSRRRPRATRAASGSAASSPDARPDAASPGPSGRRPSAVAWPSTAAPRRRRGAERRGLAGRRSRRQQQPPLLPRRGAMRGRPSLVGRPALRLRQWAPCPPATRSSRPCSAVIDPELRRDDRRARHGPLDRQSRRRRRRRHRLADDARLPDPQPLPDRRRKAVPGARRRDAASTSPSTSSPTREKAGLQQKLGRGGAARRARWPQVANVDLRRLGQGRRRQVDDHRQPRRRAGRRRQAGRRPRRRRLGLLDPAHVRRRRRARPSRPSARSCRWRRRRREGHVDRLLRRGGRRGRLARADAPQGAHAVPRGRRLGRAGLPARRPAARAPATSR